MPLRRLFCLLLPSVFLVVGCLGDPAGTRLFEVTYPVIEFVVPPGTTNIQTSVIARPNLPTGFVQALADNDVRPDEVDLVGGFRARVVSVNAEDFAEIERIEIRVCPVGSSGGCQDLASILFSQSDLFGRRQQAVDLSPSLVNFRDLFLGSDRFRMELTFRAGRTTSRAIEGRLEWMVMAVGDLE